MKNYLTAVRPTTDLSTPIHVQLMYDLIRVDELDAAKETITTTFMFQQIWKDPRLTWNTTEYGGIKSIRFPYNSVWHPDIEIENFAPGPSWSSEASVYISYDGTAIYVPHKTLSTYCSMDLALFPYDTQTCSLTFVPWTHNSLEMRLGLYGHYYNTTKKLEINVENYLDFQWKILKATASINSRKYSCCPEEYQRFVVTITTMRKTSFYRYVITWPSIIACFLVPFLFAIPSHSAQKITFGLGLMIFESLIVLVFVETNTFDHTTVPNLAIFHLIILILTSISLLLSIFIISLCDDSGRRKRVPAWLQRLALNDTCLRRILCLGQYGKSIRYSNGGGGLLEDQGIHEPSHDAPEMHTVSNNDTMRDLSESIRTISDKMISEEASARITQDWREIGRLVDRILGFLCVVTVFSLLMWSITSSIWLK
ncbi:neuronal acetylcholine receptor subunit alpha-10-like [Saccostrea echinata]|uniref:neuronal acetylcholine receptor subunit alpha-10-like n=1 Tax=Saccostrea echinata TaxID=191078 RepID=UPI002A83F410|nr:neuronal acetylcholine receptor subunit alpha-10-like [Saccostrea echinata]